MDESVRSCYTGGMATTTPDSTSAHDLARLFGLHFWPKPCPVCHGNAHHGRPLQLAPSRGGGARYRCLQCLTTFSRNRRRVVRQIERLGLYALPGGR